MKFYIAPLLVAGIIGSASAKTVKNEVCPTKVSGLINNCSDGKKCTLALKQGDVLTDITYFGSKNCKKKTGFTKIHVAQIDSKGIVFSQKGEAFQGIKKKFRVAFDSRDQTKRINALGFSAKKTKNPKMARFLLNR